MKTKPQSAVPTTEPFLITTKQAAALLSVSPWEVRRLCRKNQLAYKRLSKTNWLITTKSIRAFADVSTTGRAS